MSDINLKAEEEYEETLNRLKDYKEKLDQLIKDKQAIKAMIEEIDRKKYSAFMEAFNNIEKISRKYTLKYIIKEKRIYLWTTKRTHFLAVFLYL